MERKRNKPQRRRRAPEHDSQRDPEAVAETEQAPAPRSTPGAGRDCRGRSTSPAKRLKNAHGMFGGGLSLKSYTAQRAASGDDDARAWLERKWSAATLRERTSA